MLSSTVFFSIRRHQERRAILTPILTDFSVRVTAAPAIIFSKNVSPDCGQPEVCVRVLLPEPCALSQEHLLTSTFHAGEIVFFFSPLSVFHAVLISVRPDTASLPQSTEPYGKRR